MWPGEHGLILVSKDDYVVGAVTGINYGKRTKFYMDARDYASFIQSN